MCLNENDLTCTPRHNLTKRQRDLCNEQLAINRDVVCCVLASCKSSLPKPVKCLEGIGVCGIYGMLWEKYFGEDVDVTINGVHEDDFNVISQNLNSNGLKGKVLHEDPCVLLRKNSYNFIFLNCKTNTSQYLDSVFSNINEDAILIITTSEDSSLYWQSPEVALRNYSGIIAKTTYHRELAVRLVMAEMARACARYKKGLKILCTVGYKPQQSFTIVAKVKKGMTEANKCTQSIQKLAHCNLCESRKFISNSCFLDKLIFDLGCNCSELNEGKVIIGIGPLWAGEIFDADFIESMILHLKGYPWENEIYCLLDLILEEARCCDKSESNPPAAKKLKTNKETTTSSGSQSLPYFYINLHRHSPKELRLQKLKNVISLMQSYGYHASRTHFDPEAVRTNASLSDYVRILRENYGIQKK